MATRRSASVIAVLRPIVKGYYFYERVAQWWITASVILDDFRRHSLRGLSVVPFVVIYNSSHFFLVDRLKICNFVKGKLNPR